jgi:hypothetical protein
MAGARRFTANQMEHQMKFVNLTPHPITLRAADGTDTTIAPSGQVARVAQHPSETLHFPGFPVPILTAPRFGAVEGLGEPEGGTAYLVSGLVLAHTSDRGDVFAPATGPGDNPVRDHQGRIVAVTRLVSAGL